MNTNTESKFDRSILIALVGLVALLLGNAALSFKNLRDLNAGSAWVVHTHEVRDALSDIRAAVNRSVLWQRSFLVTGDDVQHTAMDAAFDEARQKLSQLNSLTADNRAYRNRSVELENRIKALEDQLRSTITVHHHSGFEAIRELVRGGESIRRYESVRGLLIEMEQDEERLLAARMRDVERAYVSAVVAVVIATLMGLLAVAMVIWLLQRHLAARTRSALELRESARREQLRADELETVMAAVPAVVLIAHDPDCRRITGNPASYRLLRLPDAANQSLSAPQTERPRGFKVMKNGVELRPDQLPVQTAARGTEVRDFEEEIVFDDGTHTHMLGYAMPLRDEAGKPRGAVAAFMDITDRKLAEEALKLSDRRKDEFLATLAHELRNPLAPIRNGLQIIKLAGNDSAAVEAARSMMERQLAQMVRLVDDLMDVSRITQGRLDLHRVPVPLSAVLQSAVETSRPLIDLMGHTLTLTLPDEPIIVDADLTRLAQVFMNLLNNAAKYSERGGHIQVSVERNGAEAVVSVLDKGIGIANDHLPRIFEMFAQTDRSMEKSQGGLGIGLTLVKRLVEMHGGSIMARSTGPGHGAEFIVRLPVVPAASIPVAAAPAASSTSALHILIVDDNRDVADSLAMMLSTMGHDTRTAYDGQEGVALAERYRPDVVLLDIGLPTMDGYEACRRIREQPWTAHMMLVAVTGWGQDADRRRSKEAGFTHHLVKPVEPQVLVELLNEVTNEVTRSRSHD